MIRVCNIITGGLLSDGITNAWLTYCAALRQQGLDETITIDFPFIEGASSPAIEATFRALGVETPHLPHRSRQPLRYIRALAKLLKRGQYDILHTNGSSHLLAMDLFAAYLAGVPVRIAHSRNTQCRHPWMHKLLKPFFDGLCNGRLACGEMAGTWLFGKQAFTVIPNAKNLDKFRFSEASREAFRKQYGLENAFVIGHVGMFNMQKNHRFLVEIFAEIERLRPESRLVLIGEGLLQEEIQEQVRQLHLSDKVIFTGAVNDIPNRLQAMDLMLLPSLYEGLPNVVIEWQTAGLPALLSDTITRECAPSELVEFASLQRSPREWALQALSLCNRKADRLQQAQEANRRLKEAGFDISDGVHRLAEQYRKLLRQQRHTNEDEKKATQA